MNITRADPWKGLNKQPAFLQFLKEVEAILKPYLRQIFVSDQDVRVFELLQPPGDNTWSELQQQITQLTPFSRVTYGPVHTKIFVHPFVCKHCGERRVGGHADKAKCLFSATSFEEAT